MAHYMGFKQQLQLEYQLTLVIYTVFPKRWKVMIYNSQGQPSIKSSLASSSTVAPWQPTTIEGASKFMIPIEAVMVDK